MTLEKAVKELLSSQEFKDAANKEPKLRVYAGRIKKDGIKKSAAIDLLLRFGYKIDIVPKKASKKKK